MTRRSLLAGPALLTAAKGQARNPVIGTGDHRYEVIHDWPEPPGKLRFGNTHGIAVDSQGRLIVAHTVHKSSESPDAIAIFDEKGKFVKSWGAEMRGGAHGLIVRREGSEEFSITATT